MPVSEKLTYSVVDNKLTIDSIRTNAIEGNITLEGGLAVDQNFSVRKDSNFTGNVKVDSNLTVGGEFRADTIYVENLVAKTERQLKEPVSWAADEGGVEGKGLVWKHDKKNVDFFIFKKDPNRLFTNLNLDLMRGANIMIDGTPMFTVDTLGPSILTSSLRKVGRLKELTVDGDVILAEHIFLDATSGRLGIGTDHANAALSLVDNGVEIVIGSMEDSTGHIGTFTTHDLSLVTDNTTRMKITRGGKVVFGDARAANADVTINGKLFVKELIVNTHEERQSPLEFKAVGTNNNGKGMIFTGEGPTKQFVFASSPDQFYSTEHLNLEGTKSFFIGRQLVLSSNKLGTGIIKSSLTELGTLTSLTVAGNVNFSNVFKINDGKVLIGDAEIATNDGITLSGSKFTLQSAYQSITVSNNNIVLGDKNNPSTHAIVNGKMSIGMQNVGDNAQLEVAGNIRFADKLFMVGSGAPTQGTYRKGDIVWNDSPKETGWIGWVCVREGNPGIWRSFGQIGVE
jgi:hypothetical protein